MSTTNEKVLQLSILENEYEDLLLQNKQKYQEYITALKGPALTFSIAENSKYVGLATINNVVAANQTLCKQKCSSTNLCNGANYNSVTKNCALFSNAAFSPVIPGTVTEFAIYSNIKKLYDELNLLNSQLVDKNNKIFQLIKESEMNYKNDRSEMESSNRKIEQNYMNLKRI
jgi:Flp pilus assembly protein TadG